MWALMGLGSVVPEGGEARGDGEAGSEFDCSFPASCPQPWQEPFGIQTAWFRGQGPSFGGGNAGLATRVDPRTGQHYAVTYQNQRGAVPGAGVFAKPLRVLPITGLAGMGAADVGLPFGGMGGVAADEVERFQARADAVTPKIVRQRRVLLAAKAAGETLRPEAVRAYTNAKLALVNALLQVCTDNPGAHIRLPRELGAYQSGDCLAEYDLPASPGSEGESLSGFGFGALPLVALLPAAMPAIKVAILAVAGVFAGLAAVKYIAPEAWRYVETAEAEIAAYSEALDNCGEDAHCVSRVIALQRESAPPPPPPPGGGLMDKVSGALTIAAVLAGVVVLGPPIIGAVMKR